MYSWGSGRTGFGAFTDTLTPTPLPIPSTTTADGLVVGGETAIKSLSAGRLHSLFVDDKGRVWMWGDGSIGQAGEQKDTVMTPALVDAMVGEQIISVKCWDISLAISDQGRLFSWGPATLSGCPIQLDHMSGIARPSMIPSLSKVFITSVSCSSDHCLAVSKDGLAWAWGDPSYGRLGLPRIQVEDQTIVREPTIIVSLKDNSITVTQTACGENHSLFLDTNGNVHSCGYGYATGFDIEEDDEAEVEEVDGQAVDPDAPEVERELTFIWEPTRIESLSNIIQVTAGLVHSLVLDRDGLCYVFGFNFNGQLGNNEIDSCYFEPTVVETLRHLNIRYISAGAGHNCTISDTGDLYIWGGALVEKTGKFRLNIALGDGDGGFATMQVPIAEDDDKDAVKPVNYLLNIALDSSSDQLQAAKQEKVLMDKDDLGQINFLLSEQINQSNAINHLTPQKLTTFSSLNVELVSCGWLHTLAYVAGAKPVDRLRSLCIDHLAGLGFFDELSQMIPLDLIPQLQNTLQLKRRHTDETRQFFSRYMDSFGGANLTWQSYIQILADQYQFPNSCIFSPSSNTIIASNFGDDQSEYIIKNIINLFDERTQVTSNKVEESVVETGAVSESKPEKVEQHFILSNIKYCIIKSDSQSIIGMNNDKDICFISKTKTLIIIACTSSLSLIKAITNMSYFVTYLTSCGY
ncbi:hypothetical protein SAMD00019534_074030 [Acytostelium subglobosum LB1]|uniref:hypothetical protein n=1 Tax=Acytostelium subglobosum LB1 TaxID=1410327 RepID=UPI0006451CDE|nr:hypothetical protein SAMD00019534_074030 [Acytostelium subglobosum LB1]GAM24228.1 hypothetical protein SAMD00019534_074030 [Acytostelium subglobosum LB1]|eukprot:XP_012752554.1 hypothetical protein SAMD00019534_074030 [Acytostelium subglobosum LB1]